jgi:hypothetical protein
LRPQSKSECSGYPESKPYASTYAVRTEPNIEAVVYRLFKEIRYSRPPADSQRAILYVWPLSSFFPGILRYFDLPDCYAALAAKQLKRIDTWGAKGALEG